MADKNLDEWDSDWEHKWEEEEDIYSSLEALDMVRFWLITWIWLISHIFLLIT